MNQELLELYSDYLIATFGTATATGLSEMVSGTVSHDQITRFLSERDYTSRDLWLQVKKTVPGGGASGRGVDFRRYDPGEALDRRE